MSGVFRVLHTKCKTIVNIDCYFWSIIKPCDWHLKYILVFFPFLCKIVIVFSSICLTCYQGMNWICLTWWYELNIFEKIQHPPGDQSKVCRGHQLLIQLDLLCLSHIDVTLFVYFFYFHENANVAQIWHKISFNILCSHCLEPDLVDSLAFRNPAMEKTLQTGRESKIFVYQGWLLDPV